MRHAVVRALSLPLVALAIGCNSPGGDAPADAASGSQKLGVADSSAVTPPTPVPSVDKPSVEPIAIDVAATCNRICAVSEALGCKSKKCHEGCQKMGSAPICTGDVHAFMSCAAQQNVSNWRCDAERMPELREPHCSEEKARMANCMQEKFREAQTK